MREVSVVIKCDNCRGPFVGEEMAWLDERVVIEGIEYLVDLCKPCYDGIVVHVIQPALINSRRAEEKKSTGRRRFVDNRRAQCPHCPNTFSVGGINLHIAAAHKDKSQLTHKEKEMAVIE